MNSLTPFLAQVSRYVLISAKYDAYSMLWNCPDTLSLAFTNLSDLSLRLFVVGMEKSLTQSK